jgi:hypothetical protein
MTRTWEIGRSEPYATPSKVLQRESAEKRQVEQCRSRLILVILIMGISYSMLTVKLFEVSLSTGCP